MSKESPNCWEQTIEDEPISKVRGKLSVCYESKRSISPDEITEIRCELEKVPNLVVNFDETMTESDTTSKMIKKIKELPYAHQLSMEDRHEKFVAHIKEWKNRQKNPAYVLADGRTPVKYFYEEVANGVAYDDLLKIYKELADAVPINANLEKVFDYLHEKVGLKEIPLFALSLNNKDFLEIYYERHKEYFQKHRVKLIGIAGNQVKIDGEGRVVGVIENVTDGNKQKFIPEHALMLADKRETGKLLECGVNAINIQGNNFNEKLLKISIDYSQDVVTIKTFEAIRNRSFNDLELSGKFNEIISALINITRRSIEIRLHSEQEGIEFENIDIELERLQAERDEILLKSSLLFQNINKENVNEII